MSNNIILAELNKKPTFFERVRLFLKIRKKEKSKFKTLSTVLLKLDDRHIKSFFEEIIIPFFKYRAEGDLSKELNNEIYTLFDPSPTFVSLESSIFPNVLLLSVVMRLDYLKGKEVDYSFKYSIYIYRNAHKYEEISSKIRCISSLIFLAGTDGIFHLPIIEDSRDEKLSLESMRKLLKIFKFKISKNNIAYIDFSYDRKLYKLKIDLNKALSRKPDKPLTIVK